MNNNHHIPQSFQPTEQCDSVLIAGNGPSLAQIDYDLLPENIDIFRCNQFYMEEQYFLGKKIKAAFFHVHLFIEQQATMFALTKNQEYECEHIVHSDFESSFLRPELTKEIFHWFPETVNAFALYCNKLPELAKRTRQMALFENAMPTSGVIMAMTAVAMGYTKLYIAGLDLYLGQQTYAFDSKKNNLMSLMPAFQQQTVPLEGWHNAMIDLSILRMLQDLYGTEIYCVAPTSPFTQCCPLAPKTGHGAQNYAKYVFAKSDNALKDIVIPKTDFYYYWRNKYFPK